ncbi:MAG: TonB-dependent receptor [Bacteroidota bacterium]|jgi:iron complex outermembrane receptor protein
MLKHIQVTALLLCTIASAQEKTDRDTVYQSAPVTITATHAAERSSPVTFSNLNHSEIQKQYSVQDVPVLLSGLPSITFYSENGNSSGGYSYINLRGFEQQRLSVMVNGVPQNDPEDFSVYWIDFPDLLGSTTNIQVQRGAGSAFYGPPAIGGSVNILAVPFQPQPSVLFESSLGFQEYGSTNTIVLSTRKYSATFNSGLVDNRYMFYGRLGKLSTDGYRDKSWDEINSYFFGVERLDETMTTRIHLYGGPFSDGLVYNGIPKFYNNDLRLRRTNYNYFELNGAQDTVTYATNRRPQESEEFSQPHFELLHEWKLTPNITFNNTFFYIQGDGYYDYDGAGLDTSSLHLGNAYGIPTTANPANILVRAFVGNKQWGWLPRLEIDHGTGTLTLGAELRFHHSIHWGKIAYAENLPANYDPDYYIYEYEGRKDIISLYGHELYKLRENLTLMTDLQFAYNRYDLSNEKFYNNNFSVPYYFLNPRIGLNYNVNELVNTYVNIAYTSREPRLKDLYSAEESIWGSTPQFEATLVGGNVKYDFSKPLAKPEHLYDFELGSVYRNGLTLASVNFFWMEFKDELIESGQVDIFGEPVTGNADHTRHLGIELEGQTSLGYGFSMNGNTTISYNRLVSYAVVDSESNGIVYRHNLDGNPIAGSPDFMANIRLIHSYLEWNASLDAKYVGAFYTDNTKNDLEKNDSYIVVNASMTYRFAFGSGVYMTVRGEVHNLFDALYTMSGQGQEFFPAAERNYVFGMSLQL